MIYQWIVISLIFIGKTSADAIMIYSGMDKCNTSLLLGTRNPAAIIDFNVTETTLKYFTEGCNYLLNTADSPFVGMKVLAAHKYDSARGMINCSIQISYSGNNMNKTVFTTFPYNEINLNAYRFVNLEIKLDKCMNNSRYIGFFRLLVFKHGDENCASSETRCSNGTRCVYADLACNDVYDFCNNDFHNCKRNSDNTYKRFKRRGPTSVRGIILGCIFLTTLISFLSYIIVCRKRPWWERFVEKLCRLKQSERRRGRVSNVRYSCRTNQINLQATSLQDPPPSYSEVGQCHPNPGIYIQTRFETVNSSLNIPPPLYSSENTDVDSNIDELPPPYSAVQLKEDRLEYM